MALGLESKAGPLTEMISEMSAAGPLTFVAMMLLGEDNVAPAAAGTGRDTCLTRDARGQAGPPRGRASIAPVLKCMAEPRVMTALATSGAGPESTLPAATWMREDGMEAATAGT